MAAMAMLHSEELTTCLLLPRIPAAAPRSQPGSLALQPLDTKMSFQSTICRMSSSDRGSNGSEVCWYTTGSATNSCWHSQIESKLCLACCGERLMPGVPPGRPAWAKPLERPALWGSICEPSRIHGYWWSQKARWFYSFTSLSGTFLRGNHSASCVFTVNYMLWRGKREQDRQTDRLGKKQNKTKPQQPTQGWFQYRQSLSLPLLRLPLPKASPRFLVVQKGLKTTANLKVCPLLKLKLLSGLKVLVSSPPFLCLYFYFTYCFALLFL